jgi:hypothetical protein
VDDKKKPEMLERIIAGKVNKRMAELCLLSQVCYCVFALLLLLVWQSCVHFVYAVDCKLVHWMLCVWGTNAFESCWTSKYATWVQL